MDSGAPRAFHRPARFIARGVNRRSASAIARSLSRRIERI
jgi:hypothetical protein